MSSMTVGHSNLRLSRVSYLSGPSVTPNLFIWPYNNVGNTIKNHTLTVRPNVINWILNLSESFALRIEVLLFRASKQVYGLPGFRFRASGLLVGGCRCSWCCSSSFFTFSPPLPLLPLPSSSSSSSFFFFFSQKISRWGGVTDFNGILCLKRQINKDINVVLNQ